MSCRTLLQCDVSSTNPGVWKFRKSATVSGPSGGVASEKQRTSKSKSGRCSYANQNPRSFDAKYVWSWECTISQREVLRYERLLAQFQPKHQQMKTETNQTNINERKDPRWSSGCACLARLLSCARNSATARHGPQCPRATP